MREILFRGKRKDNGEWVEGIPIKTYDTESGEFWYEKSDPAITHWMPLPEPPKEGNKWL